MAKKKKQTKQTSKNTGQMSDELLELIRVTPEQTEEFMKRNNVPTIHPKPEGKTPKGKLWCPYCNEYMIFQNKRDTEGSYKRCQKCNISDNDFHVKKQNKTFGKLKGK